MSKELGEFLVEHCNRRGISLRSLSIKSGLSAGTVHNIIKRQYLWQLAGLLEDMDYDEDKTFSDPQLRFHLCAAPS